MKVLESTLPNRDRANARTRALLTLIVLLALLLPPLAAPPPVHAADFVVNSTV